MLNEHDLQEFYEWLDKKKAEHERAPNYLLQQQIRIMEHFVILEKMLKGMFNK